MKQCEMCNIIGTEETELITNVFFKFLNEEIQICYLCKGLIRHLIDEQEKRTTKTDSEE